jgi:hypothetical protein
MKRLAVVLIALAVAVVFVIPSAGAEDFPSPQPSMLAPPVKPPAPGQQRLYYGYVPPAPIRHTWPGGYRVIFHELGNTLSEHILGQY